MLRGGIPISLYPRCCNCCEFNLLRIFCLPIDWQKRNNYHLFEWMKKKLVNFSVFYSYLFDALFSNDRGYYINFPIKKYDACSNILILARQKLIHQDSVRSFLKALDESKCIENLFISCKGVIFWNIPFNLWNLKIRQSSDFEVFQDKKNFLSSGDIDWFPYIYVYARLCSTFKHFKAIYPYEKLSKDAIRLEILSRHNMINLVKIMMIWIERRYFLSTDEMIRGIDRMKSEFDKLWSNAPSGVVLRFIDPSNLSDTVCILSCLDLLGKILENVFFRFNVKLLKELE